MKLRPLSPSRYVAKADAAVAAGEQELDEELREVKAALGARYAEVLRVFDYYCAQNGGMIEGNAAFAIGQNSYSKFIADAGLHDEKLTVETTSRIFVEVNVETQKGTIEADLNEDRGLTRFELLETFVRFATTKYEGQIADVSDAVAKFVAEDLGPKLPKVATFDRDDFRRDRLYNRETDRMLRTHLAPLKALYALYGPSEGGKPTFNLGSLRRLLSDLAFLAWDIHCLSLPKVRLAFFNSRMVVVDEIKQRHKFMTLSFIEFVEALARVADSMNVPTDEDLAKLGVASVVDLDLVVLEQKVDVSFLREKHGSADVMAESERPLVEKLNRFLFHLFGRLGLRDGGSIKTPGSTVSLIPRYITREQLAAMSKVSDTLQSMQSKKDE